MVQPTTGMQPADIEREIRSEIQNRQALQEPRVSVVSPPIGAAEQAMPDYVEHRDGATEIGKLSAEAVLREYEATAKEIESMGVDLIERVKQCETVTRDALAVTTELKEIAARYREEAKRVFEHIENCSLMVAEARKTAAELRDKFAVPVSSEKLKPKRK
jgi:hypothetical protein